METAELSSKELDKLLNIDMPFYFFGSVDMTANYQSKDGTLVFIGQIECGTMLHNEMTLESLISELCPVSLANKTKKQIYKFR